MSELAFSEYEMGSELDKPLRRERYLKARSKLLPAVAKKLYNEAVLGKLMTTLPLDLVYEILGHLEPGDLISVARSNKMLRAVATL